MKTTLFRVLPFLFTLGLFSTPTFLSACSCGEFPDFCEKAVDYDKLLVEVVDHQLSTYPGGQHEKFTLVKILVDIDQGGYADTISLINQNGINCNGDVFQRLAGDSLIISLRFAEVVSWPEELTNVPPHPSYDLFGCGTYYLEVQNGKLGGGDAEEVSLADFLTDPFNNCPIINSTSEANPFGEVQLSPNPVEEELHVYNLTSSHIQFHLYTIDGRPLETIELQAKQIGAFPMSDLPPGVYIIRQVADRSEQSRLIVKH